MQCLSGRHPQPPSLDHADCVACALEAEEVRWPRGWRAVELEVRDLAAGYDYVPYQRTVSVGAVLAWAIGILWLLDMALYAVLSP